MLSRLVQAVIIAVGHCARRLGQGGRNLLRPASTVAALAGAAGLDAVRPRSVLVAENALASRSSCSGARRHAPASTGRTGSSWSCWPGSTPRGSTGCAGLTTAADLCAVALKAGRVSWCT